MTSTLCNAHLKPQKGFSTIEAMVALIIIAIGAVGTAMLNAQSVRYLKNAQNMGRATMLAQELNERMRSIPSASAAGAFASSFDWNGTLPAIGTNCLNGGCSDTAIATFELNTWLQKVRAELPSGSASVVFTAPNYQVVMAWSERGVATNQLSATATTTNEQANDASCLVITGTNLPNDARARCYRTVLGI